MARLRTSPHRHLSRVATDERRLRSDIEHLLQLVLRQIHVVEKDQRLLVAQAAPDLCVGRLADFVAFVEGFEDELEEIGERLTACPDVGDAVNERRGPRMMRQVPEDCRLADPRFATQLNRKPRVERRERRSHFDLTIEQASNQPRADENRRGFGTDVDPLGPRSLADDRPGRIADLQHEPADRDPTGDLTRAVVHRVSPG